MGAKGSQFVRYCRRCTVLVAVGTRCSSICGNPATKGSSERPGRVESCLIFSVFTVATPDAPSVPLWVLEVPSPEVIYAKNTRGLQASHDGCLSHLSPVKLTSASSTDNSWHPPVTPEIQMGSVPLYPDGISVHCAPVSTKALYFCGSDVPGH